MQTALLGKQKDHWANGLVSKEQELSEEGSNRLLAAVGATVVRSRRRKKKKQVEHFPERAGYLLSDSCLSALSFRGSVAGGRLERRASETKTG